jgi:hypothetical protein
VKAPLLNNDQELKQSIELDFPDHRRPNFRLGRQSEQGYSRHTHDEASPTARSATNFLKARLDLASRHTQPSAISTDPGDNVIN